ncbi:hypothetical protein OR263_29270 [Streptomyces sp. NEAU-H22]|uniref:hypothetical protein n=1 Tax=unclassified Streptomyces TaxID=2593676 RepID=UPI00225BBC41|nr:MULTISPECIES: hypothetical protein [unclassified Streptomyces]MCX3290748.1 hypothetical protein [Streptomyces sp. NEAU-H22]WMD04630.1 hypothetical protein Q7C01_09600 [Streptomyces sp. FXY-T5]
MVPFATAGGEGHRAFRDQVPGVVKCYQRRTDCLADQLGSAVEELEGRAGVQISDLAAHRRQPGPATEWSCSSSETDAAGGRTTYTYDKVGRLLSSVSPLGHKWSWTYDGDGRQATAVDPRGNITGADPAQHTTTYGCDRAGNPATVTDPLGGVTTTAHDALGKVVERKDADGRTTSYGYDDLDQLTKVTAPGGAVTAYGHDNLGNLTERTDAGGHVTAYGYDAVHRLTSVTDHPRRPERPRRQPR